MATHSVELPFTVVEAYEYEQALMVLTAIAAAFEAGGWNFEQACGEAAQALSTEPR